MGKLAEFSINLNTNQQVYYPGSQLSGYVVLNLFQPMNMRGLRIEFEGTARCHWTETEGSGDNKRTVTYKGNEKYVDLSLCLFGNLPNSGSYALSHPGGRHVYQFTFTVPSSLPSSFEGKHGHIRYIMKAQIDKPWKFDHKVKRPITINEIIDPNLSQYRLGPGGEKHKTVGSCCFVAGPLDVVANIDRGCYCPGEVIRINAQVDNHTTRDMNGMKAKLCQIVTFHASEEGVGVGKMKHVLRKVGELRGPQVLKGQFATWENQAFGIPALPPSIFNSRLITVNYEVQFEVDVPWGLDPCIKMPIVLGTVPYRLTYGQAVQHYGTPEDPQQAPAAHFLDDSSYPPPQPNQFGYPDMAPPSYSAAVGDTRVHIGGDDDSHTKGELNYIPVYTFAQPYQGSNAPTPYSIHNPSNQPATQYPPNQAAPYPAASNPPYPSGNNLPHPSEQLATQHPSHQDPSYPTYQYPSYST